MGALTCAAVVAGLLSGPGGDVARTITTAQQTALEAQHRSTFVRVEVEDADGVMIDYTDFDGRGLDFFDRCLIRANVDQPISSAQITLWREISDGFEKLSIAPLIEASVLNRDSGDSYAPATNPARAVEVWTAVMEQGELPSSGDYELLWEGYVDDVEWGGLRSRLTLECRDPLSRLNDTIIETVSTYGGGSPLAAIEDVMQEILDDNMGSGEFVLWVEGDPDFGIEEYELGHVSVLDALLALRDLIGWNLHWRYQESPGDFRLTLYQPTRSSVGMNADWTFGPDDYYDLPGVRLPLAGVRNAGEVIYLDTNGDEQTEPDERSGSTAEFWRRFIRLDERGSRSIQTQSQAAALIGAILDDLSVPPLLQSVDAAFHWPIELTDILDFSSNDVHYDTTQAGIAVFGYTHILQAGPPGQGRIRTLIDTSGQPSGGYRRWLKREKDSKALQERSAGPSTEVTFNANGQAEVSLVGPVQATKQLVTVGDGTEPDPPTPDTNDGELNGNSGTILTTKKITTGNVAHVKAVAMFEDGGRSLVSYVQQARRAGLFHKDTSTRSHSGSGTEDLQSVTMPIGLMGPDSGLRIEAYGAVTGTNSTKTLHVRYEGSPGNQDILQFDIPSSYEGDFYMIAQLSADGSSNAQETVGRMLLSGASPILSAQGSTIQAGVGFQIALRGAIASGDGMDLTRSEVFLEGTT